MSSSFLAAAPAGMVTRAAALSILILFGSRGIAAQQPVPAPGSLPAYHPPLLALVQPASGGTIPLDRPAVVFRFAPGDSADPVDARSFAITVDGKDRSAGFQSARDMVWGPLAPPDEPASLTVGSHTISARICSIRGSCADVSASVTIATTSGDSNAPTTNRKRSVVDLILAALKKLLAP
jgi:hypothetical protein